MAYVQKNRQVKDKVQVRHVITSAILRQQGGFTKGEVMEVIEKDLKFSSFGKFGKARKDTDIKGMVEKSFFIMEVTGGITFDYMTKKYYLQLAFPAIGAHRPSLKSE